MDSLQAPCQECGTPVNVTDDREARSKFWIAAYTRPRSEKKAGLELARQGVETYVPTQIVTKKWSDRKKQVKTVVIPMILFAHITNEQLVSIQRHPLIIKTLGMPGKKEPAIIPEAQIDRLRFMLNESDTPVTFIDANFTLTDTVRVLRGSLMGLVGQVEKITEGKTKLVVRIDMLGGAMVEIDTNNIEIYKDHN